MFKAPCLFSFCLAPSTKCKTEGFPKGILRTIDSLYYCSSHEPLVGCISDVLHIRCLHCNLNSSKMTVAMKIILQSESPQLLEAMFSYTTSMKLAWGLIYKRWGRGGKEERRETKRKKRIW